MFADILRTAEDALVAHGLSRKRVPAAVAELDALVERDDAAVFFCWNRARAVRPR
ncbi:hypothetical protein WMF31_11335 [Sorangium sp. So ce1036]|uniref:hypothetical protein n=1 Tax=Sorangium sp. So ce1036 TaxID=3133328 RepID=UPI003F048D41